jgi:heavy metal translocating P-type ATPase
MQVLRIATVTLGAIAVEFRVYEPVQKFSVIGAIALCVGAWPIFREAIENLFARRMTMELSMAVAIAAAASIGQFFTALVITAFVLVAEELEGRTVARGRRAIHELLESLPRSVSVRRGEASDVQTVSAETLKVGDRVLVNPGSRIPVDGVVEAGHSFVDESCLTGESLPVEKASGARVYAGSINQSGALEVRSERLGRDTSYGQIIAAVERSEHLRAPIQRLADRLAGYLVYVALGAAAVTFLWTHDIRSTLSVVLVAGACGIAAGTPLAILGGMGRAAQLGAIVKGGVHLETLSRVNTVVLDKTGTLTVGRPEVEAILPAPGVSAEAVLDAAASAELRSEHPLGQAIVAHARLQARRPIEPEHFRYRPGRGISATVGGDVVLVGNRAWLADLGVPVPSAFPHRSRESAPRSELFVARAGRFLGAVALADPLRDGSKRAVEALHHMGVRTLLLSGDAQAVVSATARDLGVAEAEGHLLPEEKLERVRQLVAQRRIVAMVGDGVNDAPALVAAHVGVAMGSGTDVARESADIVLLGNDLEKFVQTVAIARRMRRIVTQNFVGTLAVDTLGIGMAAFGLLDPLAAAFIHVSSELVFLLNSARMLRI